MNNDDHDQTTLITNDKRKQDDDSDQSRQIVAKVFRSESTSLPFGIANVLQSTNKSSKTSQIPVPTSISTVNPWLIALHHLSQSSSSTTATVLSNASNWCAKCSKQFRLTSELVHHIRVHHATRRYYHHYRTTTESTVRKRSTNSTSSMSLTCHICCETFRERHHLIRHMTSHR